ncbi:type II secretion system F family protein [Candidatus Pacearchaeota archaeon]|nr:type II secretion system F family protein [Candidatus Pacearchaeota archaeon]
MELKKIHKIGIIAGGVIILLSFLLFNTRFFFFVIGIGVIVGVSPFVFSVITESKIANEKEEMFLEFTRNLVESVKTGTPISKSVINMRGKSYGVLTQHIDKLANQISLGIPINTALKVFSRDVNNKNISRSLTLIGQAERAGGDIGEILESVTKAVNMSDKLKKERKATISTLIVQGYIIFFVFMVIVLIMQFYIVPMISGIADVEGLGVGGITTAGGSIEGEEISNAFLYLLLFQGFFSGLTIGKLSEGTIKAGIKHSFALVLIAFIISSVANLIGGAG